MIRGTYDAGGFWRSDTVSGFERMTRLLQEEVQMMLEVVVLGTIRRRGPDDHRCVAFTYGLHRAIAAWHHICLAM